MKLAKRLVFGWIGLCMITQCAGNNGRCVASIGGCPTWQKWNGMCYKEIRKLPWTEAKKECIKMGGVMVVPQSEEETAFLASLCTRFWIDCNDRQNEGDWKCNWPTNGNRNMNWDQNQPNDDTQSGDEDCGAVWQFPNGKWHDAKCDEKGVSGICMRSQSPQLHL